MASTSPPTPILEWDARRPHYPALPGSSIAFSVDFFEESPRRPVPIDLRIRSLFPRCLVAPPRISCRAAGVEVVGVVGVSGRALVPGRTATRGVIMSRTESGRRLCRPRPLC